MALTAKQKKHLDIAMGGKKAADRLVAKMDANAALSAKEKKELEAALADKKAAKEIIADLVANASTDQAAVDAAQATANAAQAQVDLDVIAVANAQAALDADPGNPVLIAALAAAQAALVISQAALVAAQAALAAAKATQATDLLSSRTKKVLNIAMASKADGAALKSEIEK